MFLFFYIIGFIITFGIFILTTQILESYSYITKKPKPVRYKRWQWVLIILLSITPVVNWLGWIFTLPIWFDNEIKESSKEKFNKTIFKKFINYLNEEV